MFDGWISMRGKLLVAAILLPCLLFGGPKSVDNGTHATVSAQEPQDPKKPSADMILREVNLGCVDTISGMC
jgi:hypothetical protein